MSTRPIVATIYRDGKVHSMRHYARITTALPRGVAILLEHGQPRDVIEYASAEHGYQIGTVKVHAGGKIDIKFDSSLLVTE